MLENKKHICYCTVSCSVLKKIYILNRLSFEAAYLSPVEQSCIARLTDWWQKVSELWLFWMAKDRQETWLTGKATSHGLFCVVSCLWEWNVHTITENSSMYFREAMPWTNVSHTFEKPAFIWSWSSLIITVVNTTAFFFHEGLASWHLWSQVEY